VKSVKRKPKKQEILAHRRVEFDVDLDLLDGEYRRHSRSEQAFYNSPISWIYLHGIELEKKTEKR
jgi:hypothetical protein